MYKKDTSIQDIKAKLKKLKVDTDFLDASKPQLKKIKTSLLKESPDSQRDKIIRGFKLNIIDRILGTPLPTMDTVEKVKGLNGTKGYIEPVATKGLKDTKHTLQAAEDKLITLNNTLTKIKAKNVKNPTNDNVIAIAKMTEAVVSLEDIIFERKQAIIIKAQLTEDAQTAESIMASIAIQEEISEIQKELGKLQNDTLGKFIEHVRLAYDASMVTKVREITEPAIQELMDQIRDTKDQLYAVVALLTGDESLDNMNDDEKLGDMDSDSESLEGTEDSLEDSGDSGLEMDTETESDDTEDSDEDVSDDEWEKR